MSGFKGEYLRIRTPRTVDGINLKYDSNGQIEYKESHVAVTARKSFELENISRPNQLKHIIEYVGPVAYKPSQVVKKPTIQPVQEVIEEEVAIEAAPKKRGRRPNTELQ